MKNFPIIDKNTGREYWISRSVAVVVGIFAYNKDQQKCVLAVQRGVGTPDIEFVGTWCMPCGYLDFDETGQQAAARETLEETGITIPISDFKLVSINDNPNDDKRQNITFRYRVDCLLSVEELSNMFTTKNSEKDEVSDIKFIPLVKTKNYEWAFNHNKLIYQILNKN